MTLHGPLGASLPAWSLGCFCYSKKETDPSTRQAPLSRVQFESKSSRQTGFRQMLAACAHQHASTAAERDLSLSLYVYIYVYIYIYIYLDISILIFHNRS